MWSVILQKKFWFLQTLLKLKTSPATCIFCFIFCTFLSNQKCSNLFFNCYLLRMHPRVRIHLAHHGRRSSNDLGGSKLLPEKWLDALRFSVKIETVFSAQIKVFSKKKNKNKKKGLSWNLNGFSSPNEGVLQKKNKKKKVFTETKMVFWH